MAETEGVVTFSPGAAAEEWERHVENAEEGKTDEPKELPFIDEFQAQSVEVGVENQQELLLRANDLFHQKSIEEINDRYGNSIAGKIRAFFAGEYSDLAKAEKLGRIFADDPEQALQLFGRSRHFDAKEGLGRLGKNITDWRSRRPYCNRTWGSNRFPGVSRCSSRWGLSAGWGGGMAFYQPQRA